MTKALLKRKWLFGAIFLAIVAVIVSLTVRSSHAASTGLPTAEVRRGDFVEYVSIRGEIKARDSKMLTAPSAAGDLQILKLAATGKQVKTGDVVVLFDTTTLQRTLEQKRTDLASAEAEIRQQQAQEHMTQEQNLTDSLAAKYNVESARLDASKAEILSEIDG
jgi:multidrug efflux pump subunit AcrA (membrane-fusion protein)